MKIKMRIKGKLILVGISTALASPPAWTQVSSKGLAPAANTYRSYQDGSIARDSGLNQPLDLLNDFYPSISVTISDHDNVRARPDLDEDDLKIVASPSLAYRTSLGRHQFYAAYTGAFSFHKDLEQEDSSSHALNARAGFDLSRSWDLDVFAGLGNSVEQRGVSGTRPFDQTILNLGPDKVDFKAYGADIAYGRKLGKLIATLGFERSETGFRTDDGGDAIEAGDRDRYSDSIHLDLSYRIGAKTSIFGRIQKSEVDYDRSVESLDSEQTDYVVGVRWKPTNALSGVVGVGKVEREFDDAGREGYDGNSYYANLNYALNPFSNIQLVASRVVEEPSDEESSYYESELIGVSWDHALTPQLVFNAFAKQLDDDYDTSREDQFQDWGIGLDYAWKNWLTAGIYYGEIELESSRDEVSYTDDYFGIRLSSDLRSLLKNRGKPRPEPASFGPAEKSKAVKR